MRSSAKSAMVPVTVYGTSIDSPGAANARWRRPSVIVAGFLVIVITVCALNFLGDALRRKFDVRESAL